MTTKLLTIGSGQSVRRPIRFPRSLITTSENPQRIREYAFCIHQPGAKKIELTDDRDILAYDQSLTHKRNTGSRSRLESELWADEIGGEMSELEIILPLGRREVLTILA
jgi:hypothetical protein